MRFCLQTELLARNPAQKGDRADASPLLCMVSAQQFCLQAKSHMFCVDFPGNTCGVVPLKRLPGTVSMQSQVVTLSKKNGLINKIARCRVLFLPSFFVGERHDLTLHGDGAE